MSLILNGLFGTISAITFTCIITALFVISFAVFIFADDDKRQWIVGKAPALLTTLGLFGTFWGVAEGLGHFNASDIDGSVITLLDGMKLAFWTSILGMFYAFLINFTQYFVGLGTDGKGVEGNGVEDIGKALVSAKDEICKAINESKSMIENLVDAIGSESDTSLLTQFQKFRVEVSDTNKSLLAAFTHLQSSFENFARTMAENNSKALVEAVEEVMCNFNAKINDKLGESFDNLNKSTKALVAWQQNNMVEMNNLVHQFKIAQAGIAASQQGIAAIRKDLAEIPSVMKQLQDTVTALDLAIRDGAEVLGGFVALRQQADEVFPTIKQGITDITEKLATNIEKSADVIVTSVKIAEDSARKQNDAIQKLRDSTVEISSNVQDALLKGADDVQMVFKKAINEIKDSSEKSFNSFEKQMQESLAKVIKFMGDQLAGIHEKLIEDCQTLGDDFRRLAMMIRGRS